MDTSGARADFTTFIDDAVRRYDATHCRSCHRPLFTDGVEPKWNVCAPCRQAGTLRINLLWDLGGIMRRKTLKRIPKVNQIGDISKATDPYWTQQL